MQNLSESEVHIWYAYTDRFKNQIEAEALLSDSENERFQKFLDREAKQEFLLGRYLLRTRLSKYHSEVLAQDWKISLGANGKPAISNSEIVSDVNFNIAHSHGVVVCAFSRSSLLGIDIEFKRIEKSYLHLAKRFFSKAEFEILRNLNSELQSQQFFKYWSLKEAYAKATGLGFQTAFDSFYFDLSNEADVQIRFDDEKSIEQKNNFNIWKLYLLNSIQGYQVALAIDSQNEVKIKEFFLEE